MSSLDSIIDDARRLEKSASAAAPVHTAKDFEGAMCDLASREARPGETIGCALSRLSADRDERLSALAKAAYRAERAEREAAWGADALAKLARAQDLAYGLMLKRAAQCAHEGESVDDAFHRLGREVDGDFAELYRIYNGG
jgi:hypothetical protein